MNGSLLTSSRATFLGDRPPWERSETTVMTTLSESQKPLEWLRRLSWVLSPWWHFAQLISPG